MRWGVRWWLAREKICQCYGPKQIKKGRSKCIKCGKTIVRKGGA